MLIISTRLQNTFTLCDAMNIDCTAEVFADELLSSLGSLTFNWCFRYFKVSFGVIVGTELLLAIINKHGLPISQ